MKAFIPIASNIPRVKPDNKTRSKIVRSMKLNGKKKIIMTFGFINQVKGYEQLLDAIDTLKYDWIHIGSIDEKVSYQAAFIKNAEKKGVRIKFTGFLSGKNIAKYLASSDVCVFPFKEGVTNRHGTFLAAAGQGVYIVACHKSKRGYIKNENVYYAAPGDIEELKKGIEFDKHIKKITPNVPSWKQVAKRHLDFYREILNKK
jgi:glycosyltransferase involved in cell wall biosynthesis